MSSYTQMSHEPMNTSQTQNRKYQIQLDGRHYHKCNQTKACPKKTQSYTYTYFQCPVLSLHFLKHTPTVMCMQASTKSGPLVLHYLLMVSDNLRNQRAISGGRMIFKSSASEPISPSAHHSPTRLLSLFPPSVHRFFLESRRPGHDRLEGVCMCVKERRRETLQSIIVFR